MLPGLKKLLTARFGHPTSAIERRSIISIVSISNILRIRREYPGIPAIYITAKDTLGKEASGTAY
jgi:hypothetical protein